MATERRGCSSPATGHRAARPRRRAAAALALLLVSFCCLGLAACGASSEVSTGSTSPVAQARNLAAIRALVRCAHARGVNLPDPTAPRNFGVPGVNVHSAHFKAVVATCVDKVVGNAAQPHR